MHYNHVMCCFFVFFVQNANIITRVHMINVVFESVFSLSVRCLPKLLKLLLFLLPLLLLFGEISIGLICNTAIEGILMLSVKGIHLILVSVRCCINDKTLLQ